MKNLYLKYCSVFLFMVCSFIYSQDTINFKAYDSLKTSAEDKHRINHSSSDTTTITAKRKQLDSTNYKMMDTAALNKVIPDCMRKVTIDSLKSSAENKHKKILIINRTGGIDTAYIANEDSIKFIDTEDLKHLLFKQWNDKNKSDPNNWDVKLFRKINNARSPFKDRALDLFTRSNAPIAMLMPMSLFAYGRMYDKTYDENSAYLLAGAQTTNFIITMGTKLFIKRKRPVEALPNCYSKGNSSLDVYSFPSGHSSTSFTIATMFALRYSKYPLVYVPMYAWAAIVAYSRPYFGMHYPTDLIGGAIVGTGSSILIYSLRKHLFKFKNSVLSEDKHDEGSINSGVASFFVGSFIASSLFNTFILKPKDVKKFSILPWMDDKRSGLNVNFQF